MSSATNLAKSLVSISQFNKGQASRIFDRLHSEPQLIVLKNNQPTAFILSPNEYDRLTELEEDYALLLEAYERLENRSSESGIPLADVMARHGITEEDLNRVGDVEIE
ncbi:MAG: type II toxin-antitoxin system Phd/YefM family antitoxin [Oscillospiraceae bacterium]|nr:type II toxin-antitoxin system Phd/YefM family antitoxin [Oscillospiraceae bacterium]